MTFFYCENRDMQWNENKCLKLGEHKGKAKQVVIFRLENGEVFRLKHCSSNPNSNIFTVVFIVSLLACSMLLLQVDLLRRHSFPVYWNGDNRRVLRGHWFARKGSLDWLPLREDVAEQLEFAYRSRVSGLLNGPGWVDP